MQFLVIAHDGTDDGALERRMAVREEHLAHARGLHESGVLAVGGAILAGGRMVGSAMVMEADSEESLRELLEADPYRRGGAWHRFQIWPFRRAF
jgi:uncharacterized protein YciI